MCGSGVHESEVTRLMRAYPKIYLACHTRHVQDPLSGRRISAHQASILSHLDDVDPTRVTDLAEHMGVTPSTMSLAIKRLVNQGYVERSNDPGDGRVVRLLLTEEGLGIRRATSVLDPGRVQALLAHLGGVEREEALRGLEILASTGSRVMDSWRMRDFGQDGEAP